MSKTTEVNEKTIAGIMIQNLGDESQYHFETISKHRRFEDPAEALMLADALELRDLARACRYLANTSGGVGRNEPLWQLEIQAKKLALDYFKALGVAR